MSAKIFGKDKMVLLSVVIFFSLKTFHAKSNKIIPPKMERILIKVFGISNEKNIVKIIPAIRVSQKSAIKIILSPAGNFPRKTSTSAVVKSAPGIAPPIKPSKKALKISDSFGKNIIFKEFNEKFLKFRRI